MSALSPVAAPLLHDDVVHTTHSAAGESLLLRFLVQHGIVHRSLLNIIEIERVGSGTTLSLVDWLVQRGHVSEDTLTSVLAACLKLHTTDLAPFALADSSDEKPAQHATPVTKARHLTLVSSRPRASSDSATAHAVSSSVRRRTPLHLPHKVRRLA